MPERPAPRLTGTLTYLTVVRLVVNGMHRFVFPFLPAIARGLGVSLGQAGLLVSIRSLAGLASPASVGISTRHGGSRAGVVTGLLLLAAGGVLAATANGFGVAVVAFALLGLAKPTYDVAAQAHLADRTPYRRRARTIGVLELTWAGGLLVGAPAAGWLIARHGSGAPFLAGAVLALVAAPVAWRLLSPDRRPTHDHERRPALDRSGRLLLVTVGLFSFASEVTFIVFGAWLEDAYGLSLLALGGAGTAIAAAELVGEAQTIALTDRIGKRRSVALGLVSAVVGFALIPVLDASLVGGVGALSFALAGFELTIVSTIPLASEVQPEARARYLALMIVALSAGRVVAAAIGPALFTSLGIAANAAASAAANLVALWVLLRFVHERPD